MPCYVPIFLVASCLLLGAAVGSAAAPLEPIAEWSGKVAEEPLRQLAPAGGFLEDEAAWSRLWTAWRPEEEAPSVDFAEQLVLVGTVAGPNVAVVNPVVDDEGKLSFVTAGTRLAGPGFGYRLTCLRRQGIASVNGVELSQVPEPPEDVVEVAVTGTLRTGLAAAGGETTGVAIASRHVTWELDLSRSPELASAAAAADGRRVRVRGVLERRAGVEIAERWVVVVATLTTIEPAGAPPPTVPSDGQGAGAPGVEGRPRRETSRLEFSLHEQGVRIDVYSETGIDQATLRRTSATWPAPLVVRCHLRGLEELSLDASDGATLWTADRATYRIVDRGGAGQFPLTDGYVEVTVPSEALASNPSELTLRWVDFYRR